MERDDGASGEHAQRPAHEEQMYQRIQEYEHSDDGRGKSKKRARISPQSEARGAKCGRGDEAGCKASITDEGEGQTNETRYHQMQKLSPTQSLHQERGASSEGDTTTSTNRQTHAKTKQATAQPTTTSSQRESCTAQEDPEDVQSESKHWMGKECKRSLQFSTHAQPQKPSLSYLKGGLMLLGC